MWVRAPTLGLSASGEERVRNHCQKFRPRDARGQGSGSTLRHSVGHHGQRHQDLAVSRGRDLEFLCDLCGFSFVTFAVWGLTAKVAEKRKFAGRFNLKL